MRVLISGASGFIGRNLIIRAPNSWEIIATYFKSNDFEQFIEDHKLSNVTPLKVDLTKRDDLSRSFRGNDRRFELLLHLAANTDVSFSEREPQLDLQANVGSLLNLITALKVDDLLYLSSGAVYDGLLGRVDPSLPTDPSFPYAISKLAAERYVKFALKTGLIRKYLILRFFGAYGPFEPPRKIYTRLVRRFGLEKRNDFEIVGDGENLIDAMFVDDTVRGIVASVECPYRNLTVDFASGNSLPIIHLVKRVGEIFGLRDLRLKHHGTPSEYIRFYASSEQMEKITGFRPSVPLELGINKLYDWLRER